MLVGIKSVSSVRQAMMASPITFHLTGSRYFKTATAKSDWDFFTVALDTTEQWLRANGFVRLSFTGYDDELIASVYRHASEKIDVQLVRDVGLKLRIQEMIFADRGMRVALQSSKKPQASAIWNFLFRMLSDSMPSVDHALPPQELPDVGAILADFLKGVNAGTIADCADMLMGKPIPF